MLFRWYLRHCSAAGLSSTTLLLSSAARAKQRGGKVTLAPMNAYERRLIHLALRDDTGVVTHSEGEEPERRVVITAVR